VLVAIVADSNVLPLWGAPLAARLAARGARVTTLTFPAGEVAKTRATKAALEDDLARAGAGRDAQVVALGGGVTCDLAGFVAATWQRGLPLVLAPTSLLAMADASIGGKTGVNTDAGKNLVGSFHQPRAVYCDTATLSTLPEREYRGAFAEIVKIAAVADARLVTAIERDHAALARRDLAALEPLLERAIALKARIVARDEHDEGPRAALNFGHTVGHALEAASAHGLAHHEAVSIGLCVEGELARRLIGFPGAHLERLRALVAAFGLPTVVPPTLDVATIVGAARLDKKSRGGVLHAALPARLGRMPTAPTTPITAVQLAEALSAAVPPSRGAPVSRRPAIDV
jgi:3-dehydroquinate synthase